MDTTHHKIHPGVLYMIPGLLGESDPAWVLPPRLVDVLGKVDALMVENEKSARHFLKKAGCPKPLSEFRLYPLHKDTPESELMEYLHMLLEGQSLGILSEAGCPGIADPGAELVNLAQSQRIRVVPLTGPSSILLALMASGLNGQSFAFNGYLPIEKHERVKAIRGFEVDSKRRNQTQVFIETPYRNRQLLQALTQTLSKDTWLCVATNVTLPTESIVTRPAGEWKNSLPDIHKQPTVFLFLTS